MKTLSGALPIILLFLSLTQAKNSCPNYLDYPVKDLNPRCYSNPDVGAWTDKIIRNHGYKVENHPVITPDGYEIQLYRIPGPGQPVFFYMGIWLDSTTFVYTGNRSLGLLCSDAGYDCWFGDYRGTEGSRRHVKFSSNSKEFWNFTFDVVAANDVPTLLRKIANVTGKGGQMILVGLARGFYLAIMYLCNHPNEKLLRGIIGLSPAAYQDLKPPMSLFMKFVAPILSNVWPLIGSYALFQEPKLIKTLTTTILCPHLPHFCDFAYYFTSGRSTQLLPNDLLNVYSHILTAVSYKELEHETQLAWSKKLQKYDYGTPRENLMAYNQTTPPIYDLSRIENHTVYLLYSKNDKIVSEEYVKRQYDDLGTSDKGMIKIPINPEECGGEWGHLDFFAAKDTENCLFNVLLNLWKTKFAPR